MYLYTELYPFLHQIIGEPELAAAMDVLFECSKKGCTVHNI